MRKVEKTEIENKQMTTTKITGITDNEQENNTLVTNNVNSNGMQLIPPQSSPVTDVVNNLDRDDIEDKYFTSIDFNSRLKDEEVSPLSIVQVMNINRVGGIYCLNIPRVIKRNKVSLGGLGRQEKVQVVTGERNHIENNNVSNTLFGKFSSFFSSDTSNGQQK